MKRIEMLKNEQAALLDRIGRIEMDVREPQDPDRMDDAARVAQQLTLRRLLEIERGNLRRINNELEQLEKNANA